MSHRSLVLAGAAAVAVLAVAVVFSASPLESDDLHFMSVALSNPDNPAVVLDRTAWFQHQRPLFHATWWMLAPLDAGGRPLRALLALLWLGTVGGLARWAHTRQGWMGAAVVLLGLVPWGSWLEVLTWRSWLTTAGTASGLALGLWALRTERVGVFVAAALWAAGFKESGPFALGLAALFHPGVSRPLRALGGGTLLLALGLGSVVGDKLDLARIPENLFLTVSGLSPLAWLSALALQRWRPQVADWQAALLPLVALIPGPWGGLLVLASLPVLLRWMTVPVLACWGLASVGATWHPAYLVPGGLLVLTTLWRGPLRLSRPLLVVMAVMALQLNAGRARQLGFQAERARHQAEFLADFDPEPAEALYFQGPTVYEMDVLVWLSMGARIEGRAPRGKWPKQVGPMSGVWADLAPVGEGVDPRTAERWRPEGH